MEEYILNTLQFRLEKACNATTGKFYVEDDVAVCDFGTHRVEVDKDDVVEFWASNSLARFFAADVRNGYSNSKKEDQTVLFSSDDIFAEIDSKHWHIFEKAKVV